MQIWNKKQWDDVNKQAKKKKKKRHLQSGNKEFMLNKTPQVPKKISYIKDGEIISKEVLADRLNKNPPKSELWFKKLFLKEH